MESLEFITLYLSSILITDIIDILLVASLIYFVLKRIQGTSAERLLKGLAILAVILIFADVFKLNTISYILNNFTQVGLISLVVVFQPELRQILERVGKTKLYRGGLESGELSEGEIIINEVCTACARLSKEREGALIIFERDNNLKEVIDSGVLINAKVTSELLRNIFYPKAPLHDGAVVIRYGKIEGASCILPLSSNQNISKDLGTRHRAAVGITEITDALCIIVSEETGAISIANKGMLKRHLSQETLKNLLKYELIRTEDKKNKGILGYIDAFIFKIASLFTNDKKGE